MSIRRFLARRRIRSLRRMAGVAPVSAWVATFDTVEDLQAAMERGEGPEHIHLRLVEMEQRVSS